MRELALVMPEGSWLQTTEASVFGDDRRAAAAAGRRVGGRGHGPSATLVGCTPNQSDVATMMKRLQQLYRVEDVELNESSREQSAARSPSRTAGRSTSLT